jgi:hypothetical protein
MGVREGLAFLSPCARQTFSVQPRQHPFKGILPALVDVFIRGAYLDAKLIFRAATWLLSVAFASGLAMAFIRFGTDRPSPPWVAKLHGFAAASAMSLLIFGWFNFAFSGPGLYGVLTLLVAAAMGLFLNLGYHWKRKPLPEWLVFAHLSVAFVGFLLVGAVSLALAP